MEQQIFTFGCGQTLANRFVVITAESKERCRELMFFTFGNKWSMQYDVDKEPELESCFMTRCINITELDNNLTTEFLEPIVSVSI